MSDIRATLAEALRGHVYNQDSYECGCQLDSEYPTTISGDEWAEHLANAILSLPGVTTIALPEPTSTREDDEDDESAHRLGWWQNGSPYYITQWGYPNEVQIAYDGEALEPINVSEARFLAAALLAAADAAEAANNG